MADAEQIAQLRLKTSEPDQEPWSDQDLSDLIDGAEGDLNSVAADIWDIKASNYAELVDITEAGSSRKNSQLSSNAAKRAEHYRSLSNDQVEEVAVETASRTRRIVRA